MNGPWIKIEENFMLEFDMPRVFWGESPALLLYGSAGAGKTTLAMTWAFAWGEKTFCSAPALIAHMRDNCGTAGDAAKYLNAVKNMPRLVIDDLGYEAPEQFNIKGTRYAPRKIMRDIAYTRINSRLRTVFTSNVGATRLAEIYDETPEGETDPRGRIYSRLMGFATVYHFKGDRNKKEAVTLTEEQRPKSGVDTDSKVPLFAPEEKSSAEMLPDPKAKEIKATLRDLADKPELLDVYCGWLKMTEFKNLIPKEYYERQKARQKSASLARAAEKRAEEKRVVPAVSNRSDNGGGLLGGVQHGADGGEEASKPGDDASAPRASVADGGAAVNPKAMPDW